MSTQKLSAYEKEILGALAKSASAAAAIFDAWYELPTESVQTIRSLIDAAQLSVTEEKSVGEILAIAVRLGLLEVAVSGFRPRRESHGKFRRIAFALNAIEHYKMFVHRDRTTVNVVLTKPPQPSSLEKKLAELGWRTADIEPTEHAFKEIVLEARRRVVVMTPFFDHKGATWLRELFSSVGADVARILVLRSLDDPSRGDYPLGFGSISGWLRENDVEVYNYSIAKVSGYGRETFHAKVVLCDRAVAYVGSSNMTAASLEHSMEMGVVMRGHAVLEIAEVVDAALAAAVKWQ